MRLLNDRNVYTGAAQMKACAAFMVQYNNATSIFNNFYGTLSMLANNAFTEGMDSYEGSSVYKFQIKKMFIRISSEWDQFWAMVKYIFEVKYALYIDYITQTTADLQPDLQKLYLAVDASLLRQGIPDHDRRAWLYTADILTHELVKSHQSFCRDLVRESHVPNFGDAFKWADLDHIRRHTHELVRAICPVDITMDDNVHLAMQILGQRITSEERQDEAAMKTYDRKEHAEWREDAADRIEAYLQHKEELQREKERERQCEIERRKERSRQGRQGRREFLTSDKAAEILSEKFKVRRQ